MFMSISYRYRGKVARKIIHTLEIATEATAALSENSSIPANTLTPSDENSKILAYSAKKIRTKPTEEYSMLNPDTNSDSPSEKSKGVRLVSAIIITNHRTATIGQISNIIEDLISMEWRFNLSESRVTTIRIKESLISYEIV